LPRWILLLALAGCTTVVPAPLRDEVNRGVSGGALIAAPDQFRGETILVGGEILSVRDAEPGSELEILERPLEMEMPMFTDQSAGRFLVRHREPLNPAVFTTGRRVTVVGTVYHNPYWYRRYRFRRARR
jgi:outer membrane lipoprotein